MQTNFGTGEGTIAGAVQPNGKIVAVGSHCFPEPLTVVARYTQNGRLDPTFGKTGRVVNASLSPAADVAVQSDGKIVLAGSMLSGHDALSTWQAALVRYLPNGRLDRDFGTRGTVVTHSAHASGLSAVAVQPDGKIVAAGSIDGHFALVRYGPDGQLDLTFGEAGKVVTTLGPKYGDGASSVAVQANGKLVAGGAHGVGPEPIHEFFTLARYTPDGQLDRNFGMDGKIVDKKVGPVVGIAIDRRGHIIALARRSPKIDSDGVLLIRSIP